MHSECPAACCKASPVPPWSLADSTTVTDVKSQTQKTSKASGQKWQFLNKLNKSEFSYRHMLTTWHCLHSPATAAANNRYLLPAGPTAANLPQQVWLRRWDSPMLGQTDGWTDTVPFYKPCSTYYVRSTNKWQSARFCSEWLHTLVTVVNFTSVKHTVCIHKKLKVNQSFYFSAVTTCWLDQITSKRTSVKVFS